MLPPPVELSCVVSSEPSRWAIRPPWPLDPAAAYLNHGTVGVGAEPEGRRMTERAADLVEYVFPDVPVRQWVLTLPPRVRYVLAWDHALCRAVVGVYMRAVLGWLRQQARARFLTGTCLASFRSSMNRIPSANANDLERTASVLAGTAGV